MKRYFLVKDGMTKAVCDKKPKVEGGMLDIVEIDITPTQDKQIKDGKKKVVILDKKLSLKDFNI